MANPETTAKPWAGNRLGDPRQLLHEAAQLDLMAAHWRDEASRLRIVASEIDRDAERNEEAARDYRQWARERETNVA